MLGINGHLNITSEQRTTSSKTKPLEAVRRASFGFRERRSWPRILIRCRPPEASRLQLRSTGYSIFSASEGIMIFRTRRSCLYRTRRYTTSIFIMRMPEAGIAELLDSKSNPVHLPFGS
jgi:hypothetical protein